MIYTPVDHTKVLLGKGPAPIGPPKYPMARYVDDAVLPGPPPIIDYTRGITNWGMMLNDQLGCCVIAAKFHALQAFIMSEIDKSVRQELIGTIHPSDSLILRYYEDWAGYVDGNQKTDNGMQISAALEDWVKQKLAGYELLGYAQPSPSNLLHINQTLNLFGAVDIGLQLPACWQNAKVWDAEPNVDTPGSWGGHDVVILRHSPGLYKVVTWGYLQDLTEDGFQWACDEAHGLVQKNFVPPPGFNLSLLLKDRAAISN
jgi:hypothetical protein